MTLTEKLLLSHVKNLGHALVANMKKTSAMQTVIAVHLPKLSVAERECYLEASETTKKEAYALEAVINALAVE